jgi:hypothetical protein
VSDPIHSYFAAGRVPCTLYEKAMSYSKYTVRKLEFWTVKSVWCSHFIHTYKRFLWAVIYITQLMDSVWFSHSHSHLVHFDINFNSFHANNFPHVTNIHLEGTIKRLIWRVVYQTFVCFLWDQRVARFRKPGKFSSFSIRRITQMTIKRKKFLLCFRRIILKNNGSDLVPRIKIRDSSI